MANTNSSNNQYSITNNALNILFNNTEFRTVEENGVT